MANNVETVIQPDEGVTPTPVISRAILFITAVAMTVSPTAS